MNEKFGLRKTDLNFILNLLTNTPEVQKAYIFGSRVMGNYAQGSDVDIALFGNEISDSTIASLHWILEEESPMPYFFDVVDYSKINNKALKEHINTYGKIIYDKNKKEQNINV